MQPAIGTRSEAPPAAAAIGRACRFPMQPRRACGPVAPARAGGGIYMRGNSIYVSAAGRDLTLRAAGRDKHLRAARREARRAQDRTGPLAGVTRRKVT